MKYTNNHDLSEQIVKAILDDDYDHPTDDKTIPCHQLIQPTRISILTGRHDDDIVEDVSRDIWKLLGQAVHYILSKQESEVAHIEKRVYAPMGDYRISGKLDYFNPITGCLRDFKVTSVWTFVYGSKDGRKEWVEQLNIYAWLKRMEGYEVKTLKITAILRDWHIRDKEKSPEYPPIPVQDINIPLWTVEEQEKFIQGRIDIFTANKDKSDDDVVPCTPEERWAAPTTWAVMKGENQRASKVEATEELAQKWMDGNKDKAIMKIVERPGRDARCMGYCKANTWCKYYKETYGEEQE